ncbi:MAG TPA: nucleotide sugar dehydrogenase [Solirubrobacteraceae bacterium]
MRGDGRPSVVGVVGLGYVGLPLAVSFADAGARVIGVDVDRRRVEALADGRSHIEDVPDDVVAAALRGFEPTTDFGRLAEADAIVICVPTPLTVNREPDLRPLRRAAGAIEKVLERDQLVVLESTTFPGTTTGHLRPILERSGLKAGEDFHLAFSPERVDPGRTDWTLRTTPKLLGGLTPACADRAEALYGIVCDDVVRLSSPDHAELAKLLENIFRSVNIALVNELAVLADRMGLDIWEVVDAAATKPFGFMRFDPGPGMGGHCLPVDPFYLAWRAREFGLSTEFIELAGKVNHQMPAFCVERVVRALNDGGLPVRGSRVALFGVSYKAGVGDTRESPALQIIELLRERGGDVVYHDPHVHSLPEFKLTSVPVDEALAGADVAVIVTAHPQVDHALVERVAPRLVDLRGVTRAPLRPA